MAWKRSSVRSRPGPPRFRPQAKAVRRTGVRQSGRSSAVGRRPDAEAKAICRMAGRRSVAQGGDVALEAEGELPRRREGDPTLCSWQEHYLSLVFLHLSVQLLFHACVLTS